MHQRSAQPYRGDGLPPGGIALPAFVHHRCDKVLCASVWLCLCPAQYLPDAICSGDQVRANDKRASHEDYRACTSHDFTLGLHKLSNLDRFNETNNFHVEGFLIRDHLEGQIGLATQAISSHYPSDMCLVGRATSRLVIGLHYDCSNFCIQTRI